MSAEQSMTLAVIVLCLKRTLSEVKPDCDVALAASTYSITWVLVSIHQSGMMHTRQVVRVRTTASENYTEHCFDPQQQKCEPA